MQTQLNMYLLFSSVVVGTSWILVLRTRSTRSETYFSIFSCKSFKTLLFTFKSLIHLKLIIIYDMGLEYNFTSPHIDNQWFWYQLNSLYIRHWSATVNGILLIIILKFLFVVHKSRPFKNLIAINFRTSGKQKSNLKF